MANRLWLECILAFDPRFWVGFEFHTLSADDSREKSMKEMVNKFNIFLDPKELLAKHSAIKWIGAQFVSFGSSLFFALLWPLIIRH